MTYIVTNTDLTETVLNEMEATRQILQNVNTILNTWKGTVPLHRDFGLDADLLHRPINMVEDMVIADVIEAIEKYEPRAIVTNVRLSADAKHPDGVLITVELELDTSVVAEEEEVVS